MEFLTSPTPQAGYEELGGYAPAPATELEMPEWTERAPTPEELSEEQYKVGKLRLFTKYQEVAKIADGYPRDAPQYAAIHALAVGELNAGNAELNSKRQKTEMAFTQINQETTLDNRQRGLMKGQYIEKNPTYILEKYEPKTAAEEARETPEAPEDKPIFTAGAVEKALGYLATSQKEGNQEQMIAEASNLLGIDFAKNFPQAVAIIKQRFGNPDDPNYALPIRPAGISPETEPAPSPPSWFKRHFGGGTTPVEPVETPETAAATISAIATQKKPPIGYPDAVWNNEKQSWTIIKNGRLVILKPKGTQ